MSEEIKEKEALTEKAALAEERRAGKKFYKERHVIARTGADIFSPIALVMGLCVILHGNISPGGGFQGGVLVASVVVMIYLAYGYRTAMRTFNLEVLHNCESVAAILYIALALIGIFSGGSFAQNVFYTIGNRGELFSGGTISYMNFAVGFKVLTGIAFLILMMLSILSPDADIEGEVSEVLDE
ncbi:MAG: MnhB domain-containing protein [Eubacteriales bacterium]|nr:MnhB domain-containing protein [Eubacteriales bacterium]